jgi:hypothetical protein
MPYINYFSIDANIIVRRAELQKSALERFAKNTDLRFDELTNRTAVRQLREALGNKKLTQKAERSAAKHLIKVLTDIYPDKAQLGRVDPPSVESEHVEPVSEAVTAIEDALAGIAPVVAINEEAPIEGKE